MYHILTNNSLSIVLEGSEQVLTLRAKITVERQDIIRATWHDTFSDWRETTIRMPGTYVPKWLMAGSYWTPDGWDFVYAKKPSGKMMVPLLQDVLLIETTKDKYRRIIIQLDKSHAQEIIKWSMS
jgi:hypothetical protein